MAEGEIETSLQGAIDAGKINGAIICATDAEAGFVYNKAIGKTHPAVRREGTAPARRRDLPRLGHQAPRHHRRAAMR